MADYDNTNRGATFPNDKQGNEARPDWTGSINVDGKEYWLSTWDKTSGQGKAFRSHSVKAKDAVAPQAPTGSAPVETDEIPFN